MKKITSVFLLIIMLVSVVLPIQSFAVNEIGREKIELNVTGPQKHFKVRSGYSYNTYDFENLTYKENPDIEVTITGNTLRIECGPVDAPNGTRVVLRGYSKGTELTSTSVVNGRYTIIYNLDNADKSKDIEFIRIDIELMLIIH